MISRKQALLAAAVVVVVAGAILAARLLKARPEPGAEKKGDPTVDVRVAKARFDTIRVTRELTATVEPTRLARLASPAEGPVARLLVREGDGVRAGQLLVVIGRNRSAQARLTSDREELRKARDESERVERLVARGAIPGESLDKARADLERTKAMVEGGEETVADFEIRAPWAGIVSRVVVQEGNYVAPRTALAEVFDPATLVLRLALPEAIALHVRVGTVGSVRLDALPDKEVAGRVTRIFPELDRRLRMRTAEVSVEDTRSLAPGMFARVALVVEEAVGAVVVPAAAVVTSPTKQTILFVVDEGVARRRTVDVGIEDGDKVQIVSGLSAGATVVVGGQQKLEDGTHVRPAAAQGKPQGEKAGVQPQAKSGSGGRS